jgi:hypothetical protein
MSSLGLADTVINTTVGGPNFPQISLTAAFGGTFIVQGAVPQSTGTGVIDPFLRIHSNSTSEQGYNTSLGTPEDDVAGNFTRALLLSDLKSITINGVAYYLFTLDANQSGNDPISVDQIQIFQANLDVNDGAITTAATSTTPPLISFSDASLAFRMNDAVTGFNDIEVNSNNGSGSGDLFLFVPVTDFDQTKKYIIFYSQLGVPGGFAQTDGFEEWAALQGTATSVPDGGVTLMLLGGALVGIESLRRRFRV